MSTNVIVVTGCTAGLGYHAVKELSGGASTVVLACRNVVQANSAADAIAKATRTSRDKLVVLPEPLNLLDNGSVRTYAAALGKHLAGRRISALVNNAGLGSQTTLSRNAAGHEKCFATNHLGHFLLTVLLLPAMAPGAVVVNVASEVHDPAHKTGLPDPEVAWPASDEEYTRVLAGGEAVPGESSFVSSTRRYSRSKVCNVLFSQELGRLLSGAAPPLAEAEVAPAVAAMGSSASCTLPTAKSIRVLSLNPGAMLDSDFVKNSVGVVAGYVAYLLMPILFLTPLRRILRTCSRSGAVLAKVATGELSASAPSGSYVSDGAAQPASAFARSLRAATVIGPELWARSLEWAAVTPAELKEAGF